MRPPRPGNDSGRVPPNGQPAEVRVALLLGDLLGRLAALVLRHIDAECRLVRSHEELRSLIAAWHPEVVLADIDRFEHAPEWVAGEPGTHIACIGLTRRRDISVKLAAFERGVTDVIEVPFTPDEIVVRTMAAVARSRDGEPRPRVRPRVRVGIVEMDLTTPGVRLAGELLRLSPLEHTLFYLFLAHPNEILTRESILANVWGSGSAITSNVIDRHIRDLRVKLRESWKSPKFIETIPGAGYRFIGASGEAKSESA